MLASPTISTAIPSSASRLRPFLIRASVICLVLILEAVVISLFLDGASLASRDGFLIATLRGWGAWGIRWLIGAAVIFATFGIMKYRLQLEQAVLKLPLHSLPRWPVPMHVAAMLAFVLASRQLYGEAGYAFLSGLSSDLLALLWGLAGASAAAAAILAIAPLGAWTRIIRSTGSLWLQALFASGAACWLGASMGSLWHPASKLTFFLVTLLLRPLIPDLAAHSERFQLATPRFAVNISPQCSGLEGIALLFAFGICWIVLFRKEIRLPHALLLLPAGAIALFLLNSVRIAALVWIGDRGAPEIAAGGFHSQAGWLSFNAVALALCVAARRIEWFSASPLRKSHADSTENPVAPFLAPFLLILAAGMLSRASSADFEWLYGLRAFLALGGLWIFRDRYRSLEFRVGWMGPSVGVLVFAIWIAGESWIAGPQIATGIPRELIQATPLLRVTWIAVRILTAVAIVPIAEELAFRGFVLRRLISSDFQAVSLRSFTWLSFLLSSLLFGLLHDSRWIVGVLAGALFALTMRRSGSIGEAIAAHAVANALLAVYVLYRGTWSLW